jgi:hypothetical protein
VAGLISKRVSKRHTAKYLDIGYSRYGYSGPNPDRGFLSGIGGGASHLGVPRERYNGPYTPVSGESER